MQSVEIAYKGKDIFQSFNSFFSKYSIPWDNSAGICTDGTAACTGFRSGAVKRIQAKAPNDKWTYCFLHKEALAAKKLSPELHKILNFVVKCVILIKVRPLN